MIGAVMSLAGPGEVLVTSTTKELVTGSEFGFEDLSAHELKVPGTWQVFAVTSDDHEPVAASCRGGGATPGRDPAVGRLERCPSKGTPDRGTLVAVAAIALVLLIGDGLRNPLGTDLPRSRS